MKTGIPVFVGCNDFFASLIGMGIYEEGQSFDMTGTSEHIGLITNELPEETSLVSGPYLNGIVHYGVTGNSGTSMDWAFKTFSDGMMPGINLDKALRTKKTIPPLFLPYLQGERAPIWDIWARGAFFGLEGGTSKDDLFYSVLEGVVFSLYHIWEGLKVKSADTIRVAGGAAFDDGLNLIKASLFGIPFTVMKEKDSAAIGAAIFAAIGNGWMDSCKTAIDCWICPDHIIQPDERYHETLSKRFEIYKVLYPSLKEAFYKWGKYSEERTYGI